MTIKRKRRMKKYLGGYCYVIREDKGSGGFCVDKRYPRESEQKGVLKTYYVSDKGECDCPAGQKGKLCKHVRMTNNTMLGNTFDRKEAESIIFDFVDSMRSFKEGTCAASIGESRYGDAPTVRLGEVLCSMSQRPCVMYGETDGLLIRIEFVETSADFVKRLHEVRDVWMDRLAARQGS